MASATELGASVALQCASEFGAVQSRRGKKGKYQWRNTSKWTFYSTEVVIGLVATRSFEIGSQ